LGRQKSHSDFPIYFYLATSFTDLQGSTDISVRGAGSTSNDGGLASRIARTSAFRCEGMYITVKLCRRIWKYKDEKSEICSTETQLSTSSQGKDIHVHRNRSHRKAKIQALQKKIRKSYPKSKSVMHP
jgi:hypothetical protein